MIYLLKKILRFAALILCIVSLLPASTFADVRQTKPSVQIRKSKQTKTKQNKKMSEPLSGEWSGNHITIKFGEGGAADVEFDCARGSITREIIPDKKNRFTAAGTFAEEHGGPVHADNQPQNVAVKYAGRINGKKMTLAVRRKDDGTLVGNFTLFRGQESILVKCR